MTADRADALHRRAAVVITHDHRPIGEDLGAMLAGGVTAKVYQLVVDVDVEAGYEASRTREALWLQQAVVAMEQALAEIDANADRCLLARTAADVRRAKREGKAAILLGTEGTRWLEGRLEVLRVFHRLGLRELQLTWAYPNAVVPDGKLSDFGRAVVAECNRLGIVVDLTHIPDAAFFEVVEITRAPVIVSHGAASAVTVDLDDRKLKALASTGGLIGIHFYTGYLGPTPTPADVVKQVQHARKVAGIDHVGLGVDFFPTHGAWFKLQADQGTTDLRWAVDDMNQMARITRAMLEHGLRDEETEKVLGANALRVFEHVFGE